MHQRLQSENMLLQQTEICEKTQTQRQFTTDNAGFRESPMDKFVGISPDGKNIPVFETTPPTDNAKYLPVVEDEHLLNQLYIARQQTIGSQFPNLMKPKIEGSMMSQSNLKSAIEESSIGGFSKAKLRTVIFIVECITSLFALIITFVSFAEYRIYSSTEYENDVKVKDWFQPNQTTIGMRNAIIVFSVLLSILILVNFKLKKMANDKSLINNTTIENYAKQEKKTGFFLLIEIIFNCMFLPNGYDHLIQGRSLGGQYTYSVATIFAIINILKSYHIFKLAFHAATSFQFFNFRISFLFKAAFHKRPFLYTSILFTFTCLISTLLLQIVEITYKKDGLTTQYHFENLYNSFWVMINTLLTVGFGDGYPYTHIGRGICIILAILGTVFIGILVAVFNKVSVPTDSEKQIQEEIHIEKFKKIAALFIFRYHSYMRNQTLDKYVLFQMSKMKYSSIREDPFLQSYFDGIKVRNIQQKILQKYDKVKEMISSLQVKQTTTSVQNKLNQIVNKQDSFLNVLLSMKQSIEQNKFDHHSENNVNDK